MEWFAAVFILLALAGLVAWVGMAEPAPPWSSWATRLASLPRPRGRATRRPTVRLPRLSRGRRRRDWRVYFDETMELTAPGSAAKPPAVARDARREEAPSRMTQVIGGILWLALLIPLLGAAVAAALWGIGVLVGKALSAAVQ